jgi:hypothetical protein
MELMRGGMFDYRRNFLDRLPSAWEDWRFRGHLAWQSMLTLPCCSSPGPPPGSRATPSCCAGGRSASSPS